MITVLFLYRPVAWCFFRGMKYLSILMVGVALLAGGCGEVEVSDGTEIVYLDDGSKGIETPYVQGKIHGTRISYHEDGSIKATTPYLDGKRDGSQIWSYKDGSRIVTHYLDDKMHGPSIWYREDGSKRREILWEDGKMLSDVEY